MVVAMALFAMYFHPSVHPRRTEEMLVASFKNRRMEHGFHYASPRQALRWLEVHRRHSPAAGGGPAAGIYPASMRAAAAEVGAGAWLVSLGCGGGGKERAWVEAGGLSGAVACDVSPALVWTARDAWKQAAPELEVRGVVADVRAVADLAPLWDGWTGMRPRVFTFFGMMPNFEPDEALPGLVAGLRAEDVLLLSANLAPGFDPWEGCTHVLPQYANAETEHWLRAVLDDLDVPREVFDVEFLVRECRGIHRIEATAVFRAPGTVAAGGASWAFQPGERLRLFFSQRPTLAQVRAQCADLKLRVLGEWVAPDGQEAVWMLRREGAGE
jgi:uncharacterized SAM-dependent methyltransferase